MTIWNLMTIWNIFINANVSRNGHIIEDSQWIMFAKLDIYYSRNLTVELLFTEHCTDSWEPPLNH